MSLLSPIVATTVLLVARTGWFDRTGFRVVLAGSYLAGLAWALSLSLVDGLSGLTRSLLDPNNYRADLAGVGTSPLAYLRTYAAHSVAHSPAARGHPPGPVLLLWALNRAGISGQVVLAVLITAAGTATVPLVLAAVRGVCGQVQARRYAPVLILAPYAIWVSVSMDACVAVLGAAMVAAGVRASAGPVRGLRSGAWALLAGLLLGIAALFSYSAGWLGLSLVCLYFARRRPLVNIGTGLGALLPILLVDRLGFSWVAGLMAARLDFQTRVEPYRSAAWWGAISVVALLLACGPALSASLRKLRNTAGWPFLVGAACAVVFSVLAGLARGGVENAWLAFFPWLTVAAVAPERQAGPAIPVPLLLSGVGALTAIVVEAVLATPW
ncbi:MAG TPA: hypothetical protein VJT31_10605 [Rugosimonospora sp.]|nr:hypothetical protein [Rugosimonospora sp.]